MLCERELEWRCGWLRVGVNVFECCDNFYNEEEDEVKG